MNSYLLILTSVPSSLCYQIFLPYFQFKMSKVPTLFPIMIYFFQYSFQVLIFLVFIEGEKAQSRKLIWQVILRKRKHLQINWVISQAWLFFLLMVPHIQRGLKTFVTSFDRFISIHRGINFLTCQQEKYIPYLFQYILLRSLILKCLFIIIKLMSNISNL